MNLPGRPRRSLAHYELARCRRIGRELRERAQLGRRVPVALKPARRRAR